MNSGGVQIHIVPAFWSLFLYLWHGYRQYTPVRLKRLFFEKNLSVYRMGGLFSFFFFLVFYTVPELLLKTKGIRKFGGYSAITRIANRLDVILPFLPSMYAVVVLK